MSIGLYIHSNEIPSFTAASASPNITNGKKSKENTKFLKNKAVEINFFYIETPTELLGEIKARKADRRKNISMAE